MKRKDPTLTWRKHDAEQAVTPYWDRITEPRNQYHERLIDLLRRTPILYPGKEFILYPDPAVRLIDELQAMGIAVDSVGVWCHVLPGTDKEECCPDGMGGPGRQTPEGLEWFPEYVHLGFMVPEWDNTPRTIDLADRWNPLIRHYVTDILPQERGFSDLIVVSPDPYVPLMWDLFPDRA